MKDQKKQKQTKKYMKYWNNKKEYQKWKIENDIWYLFYQSKKNNCFNEKYYLLLILLVSYLKIDNENAKEKLLEWNLEYETIRKKELKRSKKKVGK